MTLINLVLKTAILIGSLRDTYGALRTADTRDLGRSSKRVTRPVRSHDAPSGTPARSQGVSRARIGSAARRNEVRSALTAVLVWNVCMMVEPFCDQTLSWVVPFYDTIKTLFLMWFLVTRSIGSHMLFYRFAVPIIAPYEALIDAMVHAAIGLLPLGQSLLVVIFSRLSALASISSYTSQASISSYTSQGQPHRSAVRQERQMQAIATIASEAPVVQHRTVPVEGVPRPQTPAEDTVVRVRPKALPSALQKGRALAQKHKENRAARSPAAGSPKAPSKGEPKVLARPNRVPPHVAPIRDGPAVPQLATSSANPEQLQNFAFIPPEARNPQIPEPALLLSPPPKLPGHFQFAFIPPGINPSTTSIKPLSSGQPPSSGHTTPGAAPINTVIAPADEPRGAPPARSSSADNAHDDDAIVAPPRRKPQLIASGLSVSQTARRTAGKPPLQQLDTDGGSGRPRVSKQTSTAFRSSAAPNADRSDPATTFTGRPRTSNVAPRTAAARTNAALNKVAGSKRTLPDDSDEDASMFEPPAAASATNALAAQSPRKRQRQGVRPTAPSAATSNKLKRPAPASTTSTAASARPPAKKATTAKLASTATAAAAGRAAPARVAARAPTVARRPENGSAEAKKPAARVLRSRVKTTSATSAKI